MSKRVQFTIPDPMGRELAERAKANGRSVTEQFLFEMQDADCRDRLIAGIISPDAVSVLRALDRLCARHPTMCYTYRRVAHEAGLYERHGKVRAPQVVARWMRLADPAKAAHIVMKTPRGYALTPGFPGGVERQAQYLGGVPIIARTHEVPPEYVLDFIPGAEEERVGEAG